MTNKLPSGAVLVRAAHELRHCAGVLDSFSSARLLIWKRPQLGQSKYFCCRSPPGKRRRRLRTAGKPGVEKQSLFYAFKLLCNAALPGAAMP